MRPVVLTRDEVERPPARAPPGGRAAIRADYVQTCAGDGWLCDWRYLYHAAIEDVRGHAQPVRGGVQGRTGREPAEPGAEQDVELREVLAQLSR